MTPAEVARVLMVLQRAAYVAKMWEGPGPVLAEPMQDLRNAVLACGGGAGPTWEEVERALASSMPPQLEAYEQIRIVRAELHKRIGDAETTIEAVKRREDLAWMVPRLRAAEVSIRELQRVAEESERRIGELEAVVERLEDRVGPAKHPPPPELRWFRYVAGSYRRQCVGAPFPVADFVCAHTYLTSEERAALVECDIGERIRVKVRTTTGPGEAELERVPPPAADGRAT